MTFTLQKKISPVTINIISYTLICSEIKYLDFTLIEKITGNPHLKSKRIALSIYLRRLLYSSFKNEH